MKKFFVLLLLLFNCFCCFSLSKNADSLLRITENYKGTINIKDSVAIKSLNQLATVFRKQSKLDSATLLAKRALEMCVKLSESDLPSVVNFAKRELASAHINLGNIQDERAIDVEALTHFLDALKIRVELKDEQGQAVALNNAGLILLHKENHKEALRYFNQAADINKRIGNISNLSRNLTNIGNTWFDQKDFDKALVYYESSLALKLQIGDQKGIALAYNNIGFIKELKGDLVTADSLYLKSIKIQREQKNDRGVAMGLINIATMRYKQKKYAEEEVYLTEAFTICKAVDDPEALMNIYLIQSSLDSVKHDFVAAFSNLKKYHEIKDKIKNEAAGKKILQLQMQADFDKKEAQQKSEQEKKDAINTQKLVDERSRRNYFAVGLLLMTLLVAFVYRNYRDKKRINKELEIKNTIIEEKQNEILASIHYAKRIQKALLPSENYISKNLGRIKKEGTE